MSIELVYFLFSAGGYAALLILSLIMAKKQAASSSGTKLVRDLFMAERSRLSLPVLVFTFAATLMSAFFMVGVPGFAYTHGAMLWPYVIFGDVLGLLFLYLVGIRFINRANIYDAGLPDEQKATSPLQVIFADKASRIISLIIVSIFIVPYLGVQIGGFGKLISATSNGEIPVVFASIITLLVIWAYSALSGIRGIAYSDFVQGALLIISSVGISVWFIYSQFGGFGPFFLELSTVPELTNSPGPKGFGTFPILFSSMVMFSAIMITQPQFLTRLLLLSRKDAKKNLRNLIRGLGIALAFLTLPALFMGLGGALAYPDIASGDALFGRILTDHVPLFLAIAVSVGVLAAAMSTADSILFSVGQMLTKDVLIDGVGLKTTDETISFIVRGTLLALAILAFFVGLSSNQLIVQLSSLSFAGCLQVAPAIIASLWQDRYSALAGVSSMLAGVASLLTFTLADLDNFGGLHHAIPSAIIAILVLVATSLFVKNRVVE